MGNNADMGNMVISCWISGPKILVCGMSLCTPCTGPTIPLYHISLTSYTNMYTNVYDI